MTDTTIYIGDFAIHEPVTAFTGYIITILCFYFYFHLKRIANTSVTIIHWSHFFLFLGFASFTGACSHAFFSVHQGFGYKSFWLSMQALNILSVYGAQQATLHSVLQHSKNKKYWGWFYKIQLCLFLIAVFVFHNFLVVIINTAIGLIPIMVLHFMNLKKVDTDKWVGYGILVFFLPAIVHVKKISLHAYFNYNDIAHILVMISLYLMYKGVKQKAIA